MCQEWYTLQKLKMRSKETKMKKHQKFSAFLIYLGIPWRQPLRKFFEPIKTNIEKILRKKEQRTSTVKTCGFPCYQNILLIKLAALCSCWFSRETIQIIVSWFNQIEKRIVSFMFSYHGGISSYDWNNYNIWRNLC